MTARAFVDTNILLYSASNSDDTREEMARVFLRNVPSSTDLWVSTQVLMEFSANLISKTKLSPLDVAVQLRLFDAFGTVAVNQSLIESGLRLMERHSLSYWDACIVAAALEAECKVLYTEDLQHGMKIGTLRVENPLLSAT